MRPLRLSLARRSSSSRDAAGGDVSDLARQDVEALREVVLSRAHVHADLARLGVHGSEGVDVVGEAALLADLLEQPGRGRAAEDAVERRGCEAARIGTRDAGSADADVVLLRLLALEDESAAAASR